MARFIFIIGLCKAGTTHAFRVLGSSNDVCSSKLKESRYFISYSHFLPKFYGNVYDLWSQKDKRYYLEATPELIDDYKGLERLKEFVDNNEHEAHIVVINRPKNERVTSWFRFLSRKKYYKGSYENFLLSLESKSFKKRLNFLNYQFRFDRIEDYKIEEFFKSSRFEVHLLQSSTLNYDLIDLSGKLGIECDIETVASNRSEDVKYSDIYWLEYWRILLKILFVKMRLL